jgi:hypothetical protein
MGHSILRETLLGLETALSAVLGDDDIAEAFMQHATAVLSAEESPAAVTVSHTHETAATALLTAYLDGALFEQILAENDQHAAADPAWRLGVLCAALQLAADALLVAAAATADSPEAETAPTHAAMRVLARIVQTRQG